MAIVLIGGEKGGTGKTTLATNLAAMLALQGKDVLLMDTDRQGDGIFLGSGQGRGRSRRAYRVRPKVWQRGCIPGPRSCQAL